MDQVSGLCDYLARNDTTLTARNFCEVDALVFAILCNFRFEDIFPEAYDAIAITVDAFAAAVLAYDERQINHIWRAGSEDRDISHMRQDIPEDSTVGQEGGIPNDKREFLELLASGPRYQTCTISDMAAENQRSQWAAFAVHIGDGSRRVILAMRGTDATVLGWTEDLELAYDVDGTEAQRLSAEYLERIAAQDISDSICLTGHSKGGNDVISAFVMAPDKVRSRVIRIYNFDGPGVNDEFRERFAEGYAELQDKLVSFYPQNSIIGMLLNNHPGKSYYIKATVRQNYQNKGLFGEHDPFSFAVKQGHFVEATQSPLSKWLDEGLDDILSRLSNQERENVIRALLKYRLPALIIGEEDDSDALGKEASLVWKKLTPKERRAVEKAVALAGFTLFLHHTNPRRRI